MAVPARGGQPVESELRAAQADPGASEPHALCKTQIQERSREANRLHKALEDTGIELDCVASDILGVSGRLMLDALVAGTTDPQVLADLAKGRLRAKLPALREALEDVSIGCMPSGSGRSSLTWISLTSRSPL